MVVTESINSVLAAKLIITLWRSTREIIRLRGLFCVLQTVIIYVEQSCDIVRTL